MRQRLGLLCWEAILEHPCSYGVDLVGRRFHIVNVIIDRWKVSRPQADDDIHKFRCDTQPETHARHHVGHFLPDDRLVALQLGRQVHLEIGLLDIEESQALRVTFASPIPQCLRADKCGSTRLQHQQSIQAAVVQTWTNWGTRLVFLHLC